MIDSNKIMDILFSAIDELNEIRPTGQTIEKSPGTVLFGEGGTLDSIGLVSFIVAAEQKIAQETGINITLADERAMSQRNSPFRTVSALANYISLLMSEKSHD